MSETNEITNETRQIMLQKAILSTLRQAKEELSIGVIIERTSAKVSELSPPVTEGQFRYALKSMVKSEEIEEAMQGIALFYQPAGSKKSSTPAKKKVVKKKKSVTPKEPTREPHGVAVEIRIDDIDIVITPEVAKKFSITIGENPFTGLPEIVLKGKPV